MTWCANVRAEPARTTSPRATGKARRTTTSQRRGTAGKGSAAGGHGTPTGACRGLATRGRGRAEKNTVCTKAGARWGTALRSGAAAPGQAQRVYCILSEAEEGWGSPSQDSTLAGPRPVCTQPSLLNHRPLSGHCSASLFLADCNGRACLCRRFGHRSSSLQVLHTPNAMLEVQEANADRSKGKK